MNQCPNSWRGAHKYKARYDVVPPDDVKSIKGDIVDIISFVNALSKKTYVKDICVKCGHEIRR